MLRSRLTAAVFEQAHARVARSGAPGIDGRPPASISAPEREALRHRVLSGTYRADRLLRLTKPKPDGRVRVLGVPTAADRIVQTAVLAVLGPLLDRRLRAEVHGSRPGHAPQTAIAALRRATGSRPHLELLQVDITSMFDRLRHDDVMAACALTDPLWNDLCALWLRRWGQDGRGVPQGAPLSPLLANLTLGRVLDDPLARRPRSPVLAWARYVDDLTLISAERGGALRALALIDGLLRASGLEVAPRKTWIARAGAGPCTAVVLGRELVVRKMPSGWTIEEHGPPNPGSRLGRLLGW